VEKAPSHFWTSLGIAAIVLAVAVSYRIVMTKGANVTLSATAAGVTVTIDELKQAHDALQKTRDEIVNKDRQLQKYEAALRERQKRIEELVSRATSQPATSPKAVALSNELKSIQSSTPLPPPPRPVDPRLLQKADSHLQTARQQISKLGR
jgi:Skp family chaperone for outer membrane proteins